MDNKNKPSLIPAAFSFQSAPDLYFALNLPPQDAIQYFLQKGYQITWNWHETWQHAHARAFTVAKALKLDILQDIREAINNALQQGITLEQFKKQLQPILKNKGWWGRVPAKQVPGYSPKTGVDPEQPVLLGSPWRLKTIYHVNMQAAYMAGKYKAFLQNVQNRPYWQYVAVMDQKTRPSHRQLHGKVFRYNDPFWDTFFPPNGWNCRCRVRALSKQDLKNMGLKVESALNFLSTKMAPIYPGANISRPLTVYKNPANGQTISPDPGFSYNPAKAAWQPNLDKYSFELAIQYVRQALNGPDFELFFNGKIANTFPVAVLNNNLRKIINAKSAVVQLSPATLIKNKHKHPEILLADYRKLPDIIENAWLIVQDKKNTLIFFKKDGKNYFCSVKATQNRQELYLTTLHFVKEAEIGRMKRKGTIVKQSYNDNQ
ncbi:MAG: phage minor head protein [Calditrichia bacterium]